MVENGQTQSRYSISPYTGVFISTSVRSSGTRAHTDIYMNMSVYMNTIKIHI